MIKHIAIIGLGTVGGAMYHALKKDIEIDIFDESTQLFDHNSDMYESRDSSVFICVNIPMNKNNLQNVNSFHNILDELISRNYEGIVVIKSTVLYKNIKKYLNELNIVMYPEFLNSRTANDDFKKQSYHVLGGNIIHTRSVASYLKENFDFSEELIFEHVSVEEAINFKYIRNIKQAYNLMFWEFVQDVTGDASKMMKNISVSENDIIGMGGYRGYGQSLDNSLYNFSGCLDKDINAFQYESNHELVEYLTKFNRRIRG